MPVAWEDVTPTNATTVWRAIDIGANNKYVQPVPLAAGPQEVVQREFGSTTTLLSTELNSLASSATAAYASAEVDLTTTYCEDVDILGAFQMTTSGSPTGFVDVCVIWSNDGTIYTGDTSYSGTAASYTLGAAGSTNLTPLFAVKVHANTGTYRQGASLRSVLGFIPAYFAVVVVNGSGIALHTSGSTVTYRIRY